MLQPTDLTPAQLERFQSVATEKAVTVESLLEDFYRDPYMPGAIVGTLPHCGLFGLMEPGGRSHT